jgi:Skp family chaperone for outer membrane proteins
VNRLSWLVAFVLFVSVSNLQALTPEEIQAKAASIRQKHGLNGQDEREELQAKENKVRAEKRDQDFDKRRKDSDQRIEQIRKDGAKRRQVVDEKYRKDSQEKRKKNDEAYKKRMDANRKSGSSNRSNTYKPYSSGTRR